MRISDWSSDVCSSDLLVGDATTYVSEVDESDGSIALYRPDVAVVTNISLDHKSLDELHGFFGDFADKARVAVVNADDPESAPLLAGGKVLRFGFSDARSDEHTSERQSLMRITHAVFCLTKKTHNTSNIQ